MPWRTALTVCRLAARAPARGGPRRGYRRIGSPGLRQRSAVPVQERTRAREVLRPRRLVGPSLRREHSVGWRLLRLHGPRGRLCDHGPSARLDRGDGEGRRDYVRAAADRRLQRARVRGQDGHHGQGVRQRADPHGCMDRGVVPVTALRTTPAVVRGDRKPPSCEHWEWTFAGADFKRKATKWRCPTGECQTCVPVGQDRPPAPPGSRAQRSGVGSCTAHAARSSASFDGSSVSGRCCRCGFVGWIGSGFMPT